MDEEQLAKLLQPKERSSIRWQHHYGQGLRITSKLHEGTVVSFCGSSKKTSSSLDALPPDEQSIFYYLQV